MPNIRVIAPNRFDTGTLTCSPTENASFPVANLTNARRDTRLRTSGVSAQSIRATWATNQKIQGVALTRHNLTAAATWQVRLYSDAAWTTLISGFDSGSITAFDTTGMTDLDDIADASFRGYKNSVVWFATAATTVRSMQITLTDAANPDGYLEAVRVVAGPVYEPPGTENFEFGYPLLPRDDATQTRSLGGSLDSSINVASIDRELQFELRLMSQTTRDWWYDLARTRGLRGEFFLSLHPADASKRLERDFQMLAKFTDLSGFERPSVAGYGNTFTVAEA